MAPKIRLYVDNDLAPGVQLDPPPAPCHYLLTVMRRQSGDEVTLFNGREGEWLATVELLGRRRCRLAVREQLRPQAAEAGPALLFAPLKRTRQEMLIEKATELGVGHLQPVLMQHSVVERLNRERLVNIAIEAAEQSGRITVPEIAPPLPLESCLAGRRGDGRLYLADEEPGGRPLLPALQEYGAGDLLIGPEGGLGDAERAALHGRPEVVPVSLGPRILRAETAALAALACWQAVLGGCG